MDHTLFTCYMKMKYWMIGQPLKNPLPKGKFMMVNYLQLDEDKNFNCKWNGVAQWGCVLGSK